MTEQLKNGDFILIRNDKGEEVKAKFLKYNSELTKMQVFAGGKLAWVNSDQFVKTYTPDTEFKAPMKVTKSEKKESQEAPAAESPKKATESSKKSAQGKKSAPKAEKKELKNEAPEIESNEAEVSLSKHQISVLEFLQKKSPEQLAEVSMETGLLMPQVVTASEGLVTAGLITSENTDGGTILSITQKGTEMKTAAKKSTKTKKVKSKKEGEATTPSKRDQVIALLKNKDLSVNDIAEKLDTDPNYVREVKASMNKEMDEPDPKTTKGKVFKMLKDGKSPLEIAEKLEVTSVYVYKIRKQMISANVI